MDVAALAPEGLPKDVTPEEVAAIAAAAAQIQMAGAGAEDEHRVSESGSSETEISEPQISAAASQGSSEPAPVGDRFASAAVEEAKTEALQENKIDGAADAVAAAEAEPHLSDDAKGKETQDLPVTMAVAAVESAAASGDGSRWMAAPATLDGEEATISLEQEMQKAYARVRAVCGRGAESASTAVVPEAEAASVEHSSTSEGTPAVEAWPVENLSSPEVATVEADAASAPVADAVISAAETVVADASSPVAPEAQELQPQEVQPVPEAEPVVAEAETASDSAAIASADEPTAESKPDSEAVKSTAAAWASWRQIRDTRKDGEVAQAESRELEVSEPAPAETTAMAVAAGAEQIVQEASAAQKGDPADVASIVESVLANLRPKLMEEISRKMAEKK